MAKPRTKKTKARYLSAKELMTHRHVSGVARRGTSKYLRTLRKKLETPH